MDRIITIINALWILFVACVKIQLGILILSSIYEILKYLFNLIKK